MNWACSTSKVNRKEKNIKSTLISSGECRVQKASGERNLQRIVDVVHSDRKTRNKVRNGVSDGSPRLLLDEEVYQMFEKNAAMTMDYDLMFSQRFRLLLIYASVEKSIDHYDLSRFKQIAYAILIPSSFLLARFLFSLCHTHTRTRKKSSFSSMAMAIHSLFSLSLSSICFSPSEKFKEKRFLLVSSAGNIVVSKEKEKWRKLHRMTQDVNTYILQ